MAVRFDAADDRLLRTTNNLSTSANWTVTFWVYLTSDLAAFSCFMYLGTNNYGGDYCYVGTDADGNTIYTEVTGTGDNGTSLSTGTWYHLGVVYTDSSGSLQIFLNGVLDASVSGISLNNTRWEFGAVGTSNFDWMNGRVAAIKRFDGIAMTAAQITQEMNSIRPVDLTNLAGWWPTLPGASERLADYGPNGYTFTAGGTLTDEAHPPIGWGYQPQPYVNAGAGGPASQNLSPDSVNLDTTVGQPTLTAGVATLAPDSVDLDTTVGQPTLSGGIATLSLGSVDLDTQVGQPTISAGVATLAPAGTDLDTTVGQPSISAGTSPLAPDGQDLDTAVGIIGYQGGTHYALRFYGTGADDIDRIKIPVQNAASAGTLMDVGATDFTIEWKMRCGASDNNTGTLNRWIDGHIIFDRDIFGDVDQSFGISMADGDLQFGSGSSIFTIATSGASVDNNAWHDVAAQRTASTGLLEIYVDGQRAASGNDNALADISYPHGYWDASWPNNPYLVIGAEKHDAGPSFPSYNGLVANVRVSTTRRYSGSYSPPTQPFAMDASTVGLYVWPQDSPADDLTFNHADLDSGSSHGQVFFGGDTGASGPVWVVSDHFVGLNPNGTDLGTAVGTPTISALATIAASGTDLDTQVGQPTLAAGTATLAPDGIDLGTAVGEPALSAGAATLAPDSVNLDTTVGEPTLSAGVATLSPDGTDFDTVVGQPTISAGATLAPDSVDLDTVVGQPVLSAGTATLAPDSVDLDTQVGAPTLSAGAATLSADGTDLDTAVGAPALTAGTGSLTPNGTDLDTVVGQPTLVAGVVSLSLESVNLDTTIGQPTLVAVGATLAPDSVDLDTTVGQPTLSGGIATLSLGSVDLNTQVGQPILTPGTVTLSPLGIDLGTAVGAVTWRITLAPDGVNLGTIPGQPVLSAGAATLALAGVDLQTEVGTPSLVLFVLIYQSKIRGIYQLTTSLDGSFAITDTLQGIFNTEIRL